jgi:hypothetical protein
MMVLVDRDKGKFVPLLSNLGKALTLRKHQDKGKVSALQAAQRNHVRNRTKICYRR